MSSPKRTPAHRPASSRPRFKERRASDRPDAEIAPLQKVKAIITRPIQLRRVGMDWRFELVERRTSDPEHHPAAMALLCAELGDRLRRFGRKSGTRPLQNLVLVHQALSEKGWTEVALLPADFLQRALVQARALAGKTPSPGMTRIVARLAGLQAAAQRQEEAARALRETPPHRSIEVSEVGFEEYEHSHNTWFDALPHSP